jgi:hypothetical protein
VLDAHRPRPNIRKQRRSPAHRHNCALKDLVIDPYGNRVRKTVAAHQFVTQPCPEKAVCTTYVQI